MSHNIEFNKQRNSYSFYSAKTPGWHMLGITTKDVQDSESAIKLANLDFEVLKLKNYCKYDNNLIIDYLECPNSYSLLRKDTNSIFADKVTKEYQVIQNIESFKFIDDIIGSKQAIIETAGALYDGCITFVTAKLPNPIVLKKANYTDTIDCYLLVTNSHDGSTPIKMRMTPIRVVCWNTLQSAMTNSKDCISFRHTTNVHDRLEQTAQVINIATSLYHNATKIYNMLIVKKLDNYEFQAQKYICNLFLKESEYIIEANKVNLVDLSTRKMNVINDVFNFTMNGIGQQTATTEGTAFGLYNGVTGYFQHKKYLGNNQKEIDEKRVNNTLFGSASDIMYKALNNAYQLVTL